jgi:hypothetical protein
VEASLCLCPCPVEAEFVQAEEAERFAAPAEVPHCAREAAGDSAVQVVPSAAGPNSFLVAADGPLGVPEAARCAVPAGDSAAKVAPLAAERSSVPVAEGALPDVPAVLHSAPEAQDGFAVMPAPFEAVWYFARVAEAAIPDVPAVLHSAPEAQAAIAEMLAASEAAQRFSLHPEDGAPVAHSCCFPDCSTADHSVDDRLPALSLRWAHSFHFRAVRYLEDAAPVDPERCSLTVGFRDC